MTEIEQQNNSTLFIIGNGFDIASDIKSSYLDFKQWLKDKADNELIDSMDRFFSNQRDVWGDIEKALGEYDEDSILDECVPSGEIDYDHPTSSIAAVEDSPDWFFKPILEKLTESFEEWVNSINIMDVKKILELPMEGLYLTFNYTETLEKIYGIPESNILHIHGSRLTDKAYIFGHNTFRNPDEAYNDDNKMFYIQEAWRKIIEWMNEFVKDSAAIIHTNQSFFNGLSDIKQIIVYGLSFSEIDWPYLDEIIRQTGKDKPWFISYHDNKDSEQIKLFVQKSGLKNVKTFNWQPVHIIKLSLLRILQQMA